MTQTNPLSSDPIDQGIQAPVETAAELVAALIGEMTLPPNQIAALKALIAGGTPVAAARAAGVHRGTLYRWIKNDEPFRAALAECREASQSSITDQFLAMADDCMNAISTAILKGDAEIALRVLKMLKALPSHSPTTPRITATLAAAAARQE